jgi:hypothetical protein
MLSFREAVIIWNLPGKNFLYITCGFEKLPGSLANEWD